MPMGDWVVLAPTCWSLRRAARIVHEALRELRVEQRPDKTFARVDQARFYVSRLLDYEEGRGTACYRTAWCRARNMG